MKYVLFIFVSFLIQSAFAGYSCQLSYSNHDQCKVVFKNNIIFSLQSSGEYRKEIKNQANCEDRVIKVWFDALKNMFDIRVWRSTQAAPMAKARFPFALNQMIELESTQYEGAFTETFYMLCK